MADPNISQILMCLSSVNSTTGNLTNITLCVDTSKRTPVTMPLCQIGKDRSIYPLLVVCFFAFLENAFTCYIIYANKILRTATNTFVFSLCVANALCAGVLFPVKIFCSRSLLYGFLAVIIVFTYCANLSAVTYERLISITKPLRYQSLITKRVALRIALLAWVVPTCFGLLPLIWKGDQTTKAHKIYIIFSLAVFLVAPFFFICFVYTRISIEVHRLLKASRRLQVFSYDDTVPPKRKLSLKLSKPLCCSSSPESVRNKRCSSLVDDKTVCVNISPDLSECRRSCIKVGKARNSLCDVGSNNNAPRQPSSSSEKGDSKHEEKQRHLSNGGRMEQTAEQNEGSSENFEDHARMCDKLTDAGQSSEAGCSSDTDNGLENRSISSEITQESAAKNGVPSKPHLRRTETDISYLERSSPSSLATGSPEPIEEEKEPGDAAIPDEDHKATELVCMNEVKTQNGYMNGTAQVVTSDKRPASKQVSIEENSKLISTENEAADENVFSERKRKSFLGRVKRLYSKADTSSSIRGSLSVRRRSRAAKIKNILDEVRASTAFAAVAVTYMFTWIPVIYMTFMEAIGEIHKVPVKTMLEVNTWTIALNTFVDPIIYALILKNFRKTIKKHFKRMFSRCSSKSF